MDKICSSTALCAAWDVLGGFHERCGGSSLSVHIYGLVAGEAFVLETCSVS